MIKSKKRKRVLCPKCHKPATSLAEVGTTVGFFNTTPDGLWDEEQGTYESGDILYVNASCDCGHTWRLKNVATLAALIADP
ncbi:MAG: hypothetical protein WC511_01710 [Candidatus Pacearchaeota archaeon]